MVVGEQNSINLRKVFEVNCWIRLTGACDAWPEVNMVASVEKVWLFEG